jgi:hypothetical protein
VLALAGWAPADGALVASARGGRQWLGWTPGVEIAAATWDLHAAVAHAKAGKKARNRPAPRYPRPKAAPRTAGTRGRRRGLADLPGAIDTRDYPTPRPDQP